MAKTEGVEVEALEKLYALLAQCIYRHRNNSDKTELLQVGHHTSTAPKQSTPSQRQGVLTDHHLVREEVTIAPGVSPPYVSSALKLLPAEYPAGLLG